MGAGGATQKGGPGDRAAGSRTDPRECEECICFISSWEAGQSPRPADRCSECGHWFPGVCGSPLQGLLSLTLLGSLPTSPGG